MKNIEIQKNDNRTVSIYLDGKKFEYFSEKLKANIDQFLLEKENDEGYYFYFKTKRYYHNENNLLKTVHVNDGDFDPSTKTMNYLDISMTEDEKRLFFCKERMMIFEY